MFNLQNKKKLVAKILLAKLLFLSFVFLSPQVVLARPTLGDALPNAGTVAGGAGLGEKGDATSVISSVITVGLQLVGLIFFVLICYGGFNWMMARGNEQQIEKSKNTVFAAVIGLVVVLGAYAITNFATNLFG